MNETLANYSNLTLYSAMAVITLAMIGYAVYLAGMLPARGDASADRERELVGAAAGATAAGAPTAGRASGSRPAEVASAGVDRSELASPKARSAAGIAFALSGLATLLLIGSVVLRGLSVQRWPLGNMFEFGTAAAMFVMICFLIWSTRRDLRWLGLFVTGPVLLVCGLAVTVWYTPAAELVPSLRSYWLIIHVTVAVLATALFALGAAASALQLIRQRSESTPDGSWLDRLPSSRALERMSYGMHIVAFPMWTFTLIAGAIWARQAWGSYWNWDPKEVWTFIIWVVYAAYLHARATSGWSRAQTAWIALAGFVCILINYGIVNVFFASQHSYSGL